jgi:hypothetical protein
MLDEAEWPVSDWNGRPKSIYVMIKETHNSVQWEVTDPAWRYQVSDTIINPIKEKVSKTKETKYWVVGGPFNGEWKAWTQLTQGTPEGDEGYFGYNASGWGPHSKLFIHCSLLGLEEE